MVAEASAAKSLAAAREAEALGGRRLHGDAPDRHARDLGDPGAHRVAVRADLRSLADDGEVEMRDHAAGLAHARARRRRGTARSPRPSSGRRRAGNAPRCRHPRGRRAWRRSARAARRQRRNGPQARPCGTRTPPSVTWSPGAKAWTSKPEPVRTSPCARNSTPSAPQHFVVELVLCGELHVAALAFEQRDASPGPSLKRAVIGKIVPAFSAARAWAATDRRIGTTEGSAARAAASVERLAARPSG